MVESPLTPEEIILHAFGYFNASAIDEASLVRVALAANCPSPEIALQVLANMVNLGLLTRESVTNQTVYSLPTDADKPVH